MRAELQRSIFLACVGLLAGFALVVTLYGAGTLFKRGLGSPGGSGTPDGSAVPLSGGPPPDPDRPGARPPGEAVPPAEPAPRPREGAAQPAGKPLAAWPNPGEGPGRDGAAPSFDIIRIEPNGEAVIAGRAAPNTTVELLRDTVPMARALVDPSGQFAIVPPALPPGTHEITLRVTDADGGNRVSRDSVAVVIAANRATKPLIALTSPDKPTIVLSQPDAVAAGTGRPGGDRRAPKDLLTTKDPLATKDHLATNMPGPAARASRSAPPPAGQPRAEPAGSGAASKPVATEAGSDAAAMPVKIVSVEAEEGGRLYVTSQAQPGATVRLYLNDTLVAPGSTGADGRVAFTIGRGVRAGDYKIRVDQVDPVSGKVRTRSEVAFAVPAAVMKQAAKAAPEAPGIATSRPVPTPTSPAPERMARSAPGPVARAGTPENPVALPPEALPKEPAGHIGPGPRGAVPETTPAGPSALEGTRTVFVPEVGTTRIARGDSLWQISRRIYGRGTRYTVIFDANQPQIRNPNLIYPGQIFVLPNDGTAATPQDGTRG